MSRVLLVRLPVAVLLAAAVAVSAQLGGPPVLHFKPGGVLDQSQHLRDDVDHKIMGAIGGHGLFPGRRALLKKQAENSTSTDNAMTGGSHKGNSSASEKAGRKDVQLAIALLSATGLTSSLTGATIFAPSDKALKKLAQQLNVSTIGALLKPPYDATSLATLKYHVIPGKLLTNASIPSGTTTYSTADAGKTLQVKKSKMGGIEVLGNAGSKAKVLTGDISWAGNVVHVISAVLQA